MNDVYYLQPMLFVFLYHSRMSVVTLTYSRRCGNGTAVRKDCSEEILE